MTTKILLRRDYSWNWSANNPELSPGEIGYELDTGKFKWGLNDGLNSNIWNELSYYSMTTTAQKLENSIKISLIGDITGSIFFDGSTDIELSTTLNNTNITINWDHIYQKPSPIVELLGDVIGHASFNNLDNLSITTSIATAMSTYLIWDNIQNIPSPTITLTGAVSGTGTMNKLGDVTIHVSLV